MAMKNLHKTISTILFTMAVLAAHPPQCSAQADEDPTADALVPWSRQIGFIVKSLPVEAEIDSIQLEQNSSSLFTLTLRGRVQNESPQRTVEQLTVELKNMRTVPRIALGKLTVDSIRTLPLDSPGQAKLEFALSCRFHLDAIPPKK
jgi:hypothetical protein